jgi:polysaccharide export outer membrane protein
MEFPQRTLDGMISRVPAHGMGATRKVSAARYVLAMMACAVMVGCVPGQTTSLNVRAAETNPDYVHLVPITPQVIAQEGTGNAAGAIPPALLAYQPQAYQIGPGDTLYITVWNHPELTSPAGNQNEVAANGRVVQADGSIYYPFAGKVQAAGKTIGQLRELLASKLSTYLKKPEVDVSVLSYDSQHVVLQGRSPKPARSRSRACR